MSLFDEPLVMRSFYLPVWMAIRGNEVAAQFLGLAVESDQRDNRKHNEKRQNDDLRDEEWQLGLCRRQQCLQRRRLNHKRK